MLKRVKSVGEEDRISELPLHIIHHILCRTNLDVKEAAKTCILSKRWYYSWTSRPDLVFSQFRHHTTTLHITLENFVKLIDQSLRYHVKQNLHLEKFSLACHHDPKLASHLDHWIELAVKLNVKVLGVSTLYSNLYSLPDVIYAAKNLTTLWLSCCKFEFDITTTHIRLCCLEYLYLYDVHISDAQLQRVIDRCPSIRNLSLVDCQGISKLHVFGLVHLKKLNAFGCKLDSVIVQAPNIQCFGCTKFTYKDNFLPWEIDMGGYNTLQTLTLSGASNTDQQFRDVSYKLANISELRLIRCHKLKNIDIHSETLKKFSLLELNSLEKVAIQAPNLLKFILSQRTNLEKVTIQAPKLLKFNFDGEKNALLIYGSFFPRKSWTRFLLAEHSNIKLWRCGQQLTKSILIYEEPKEIVIPPSYDIKIFIAPMLSVLSTICNLMTDRPKIMSILPCTNNKALQVLSALKWCTQMQNGGKECPFNTELFHRHPKLKEVISCTGTSVEEMASIWCAWLKSTSLIDQVKIFMFKWN